MRRVIASTFIVALLLCLLVSVISCTQTIYMPPTPTPISEATPVPTAPPGYENIWDGLTDQGKQDILNWLEANKTTTRQAITNFLNDPHVNAVLWEEWNIFDEYSASVSLNWDWKHRYEYECTLRERAIECLNQLKGITAPSELTEFWALLAGTIPFDINNSDTWAGGGPLGYYIYGCVTCTGSGLSGQFTLWLRKQGVDKNTQAWLSLKNTCRQYDVKMEWPLPRTPQWPEPYNPTPHY